jgi:hypothetical protein
MKIKIKVSWENFSRFLRILEVLAIIIGIIFAGIQVKAMRDMQSAQLMLEFNTNLDNGKNAKIIETIENNGPILKNNGGQFSGPDVDGYLSTYELLSNAWDFGLINDTMLYNAFNYDLVRTYQNKEIQSYLVEIRKENPLFFAGFENLAKSLLLTK